MPSQDNAYLRDQQMRWLRCDAARWVRPDAARFLKPGTRLEDVYPALALKYNANQPRVPAGNPDGGQWTSGNGGSGRPRVIIDTTEWDTQTQIDLGDEINALRLFNIKPDDWKPGGIQFAGDPRRGIGDNGGPPLEPPEIPNELPATKDERMKFVRDAARWLGRVGRRSPVADAFFGAAAKVEEINRLTDMIRTANDPPRSFEELSDRVSAISEPGYHDHHIVGQHAQNRQRFGDDRIDSRINQVRIPALKHLDLNGWYSRPNPDFGGSSPRDYLRQKSWDEQMEAGLEELRKKGIITR